MHTAKVSPFLQKWIVFILTAFQSITIKLLIASIFGYDFNFSSY